MKRPLRWVVANGFMLAEMALALVLVALASHVWLAVLATILLVLVSYAAGMERGIMRALGRPPHGGTR